MTGDAVGKMVAAQWVRERARRQFQTELFEERNGQALGARKMDGEEFLLNVPPESPTLWGGRFGVYWVEGEGLLLVGGDGVGKTTLAQQLALRRLGIGGEDLLDFPVAETAGRLLYLAMDRPDQVRRSFARMVLPGTDATPELRVLLRERLAVWKGPVPVDLLRAPDALDNWIVEAFGSDVTDVFVDSYKDLAPGISDDAVGAGLNSAMQEVLARGRNWVGIHHQRKATADNREPTDLADVYGSRWITAGMGSVVMFVGRPGGETVSLRHLKQPARMVPEMLVRHEHATGATSVVRASAAWEDVLAAAGALGLTSLQLSKALYNTSERAAVKRTERLLSRAVSDGEVVKEPGKRGGVGGSSPARYLLAPKDEE